MKCIDKIRVIFILCAGFCSILFFVDFAFAAESTADWRSSYDLVLRWVNFGIIVFLLIKFAKKPLITFLRTPKETLSHEINLLEKEKEKINQSINATTQQLEESVSYCAELKERLISQGMQQQQKIIEGARIQSASIMEASKQNVEMIIQNAKNSFRSKLVDAAFGLVMEKIPNTITDEDNRKLLIQYMDHTSAMAQSLSNKVS